MVTVRWPHAGLCMLAVAGLLLTGCRGDRGGNGGAANAEPPVGTAGLPSAPPVTGDPVVGQPVFNDPTSHDPSENGAILVQLARLVTHVPRGGTIELAIHQFDVQHAVVEKQIVRSLVDRAHHGVRVRVLMNGENLGGSKKGNTAMRMLRGGFHGTNSWVGTCSDRTPHWPARGCLATRLNHNKFALFSTVEAGGKRHDDVVFQSSSNINDFYTTGSWNDSFTVPDAKLYAGYRQYFADLVGARDRHTLGAYREYWPTPYVREVNGSDPRYHAFMYPRAGAADPIVHELDGVSCDRSPTGSPGGGGALINLAMMSFTDKRLPLAQKLAAMARDGCSVTILYYPGANDNEKKGSPAWSPAVLKTLRDANVILFPCKTSIVLHTKVMTIEGYVDNKYVRETYTGSANLTAMTRSDDVWLRIVDPSTAAAYAKWMNGDVGARYCLPKG